MQFAPKQPVPIFPLPEIVLFPGALLPLHVFELRYRTMVRDALSGERLIVLALLKPGWERDYRGSPDFHRVGCLARFEDVEWLPNDCYNLKVLGLGRVRIGRITREYPYRAGRVEPVPQAPLTEDDPLIELERLALVDAWARHVKRVREEGSVAFVPNELEEALLAPRPASDVTFERLVNAVCMAIGGEAVERLALLELDSVLERSRRVRELIEGRLRASTPRRPGASESN